MPIDARIPLSALANPQQPIDLIGMARQASALHAEQAQAAQQARKAAGQKAFQLAVQEASGDYDTAADLLDKRGFGDVALGLRSDLAKYREQTFKAQGERLKSKSDELKLFTTLANLITDDTSQQMVIKSLSPELQQQAVQTLGPTYDPNRVKLVQDALLTQKDKSEIQSRAFRDFLESQKLERGTAEWVQKQTSALGQYLSATNTPQEYAEVLENAPALGISPEVARLFVGGSAETAAKIGMSAKERAELERQNAQLAETQRHNRSTEAIAGGQLNVARGNLAVRRQEVLGGTGGGGTPSQSDAELIDAIMANPAIYAGLTPTVKTRLAGPLAKKGFTGFAATTGGKAGGPDVGRIFNEIETLSGRINTEAGPAATISGLMRRGKAAANVDNDVAEYQALVEGMIPMVARAVGHTGVLTQQDVESVRAMFPRVSDNKTLARNKIARVKSLLGGTGSAAPAAPSGDFSVTAPNGKTYTFKTRGELEAFKLRAGIR